MAVDVSKQCAIKAEIEEAVKAIAIKHGLHPDFTEWSSKKPSSTTWVRPKNIQDNERYVKVEVNVEKW